MEQSAVQGTTLHLNMLDTFPVLIVDVDRYGNLLFANKRARDLLALPDDLEDITLEQILDAESHKAAMPLVEQLFSGEGDVTTTWALNMPGPEVLVTVNAIAIVENDYPIRVRLFLHNVTEPAPNAAVAGRFPASVATGDYPPASQTAPADAGECHQTREYLDTLLQKSGLLVYLFDRQSILVDTNRRFVEVTGYGLTDSSTLQDLLQKLYPDGPTQRRAHQMHADMFRAKHAREAVYQVRTRSGAYRHIAWSSGTLRDAGGKQTGFLVVGMDVTRRMALEAQLRATTALLDRVSDAVVAIDRSGRIVRWLAGARRMLGYEPAQVRGKRFIDLFPAEKRGAIERSFAAGMRRDRRWSASVLMKTAQGRPLAARIDVGVLPGADGAPAGMVAVIRDQTREKQLEAALKRAGGAGIPGKPRGSGNQ